MVYNTIVNEFLYGRKLGFDREGIQHFVTNL